MTSPTLLTKKKKKMKQMEDRINKWKKGRKGSRQADLLLDIHINIYIKLFTLKIVEKGVRTEVSKIFC